MKKHLFKKAVNNDYILSLCSKFFIMFFGFVSLIFLNRFLGAELKGKYSSILNFVTIISAILQLGISLIYPRFKRKHIKNCYEIFISLSVIQFIIYLAISAIAIVVTHFNTDIAYISIVSTIAILTTQLRYINLVENIKKNTLAVFIMSASNCLLTFLAFILFEKNLSIAIGIYVIKDLIMIVQQLLKVHYSELFKKEYFKYYWSIIKEGFLPMLSGLLIMLNYKVDIVMLNAFSIDYAAIGIYSLGLSIAEYIWVIPDIFKDVVQKRTAKNNSIDTINFSLRCSTTFTIITFLVIAVLNRWLFCFLFGEEYGDSYYITMILFIGVYAILYYKIIGQLFISDGRSKEYFIILLIGALVNIIINYFVIPINGIYGAVLASVISYGFIGIIFLGLYSKHYKVKIKDTFMLRKSDFRKLKKFIIK